MMFPWIVSQSFVAYMHKLEDGSTAWKILTGRPAGILKWILKK